MNQIENTVDVNSEKYQVAQPLLHTEHGPDFLDDESCHLPETSLRRQRTVRWPCLSNLSPWHLHGYFALLYSALFLVCFVSIVRFNKYETALLPRKASFSRERPKT